MSQISVAGIAAEVRDPEAAIRDGYVALHPLSGNGCRAISTMIRRR